MKPIPTTDELNEKLLDAVTGAPSPMTLISSTLIKTTQGSLYESSAQPAPNPALLRY